mgnify:CR=1 FL=1
MKTEKLLPDSVTDKSRVKKSEFSDYMKLDIKF